MTIYFNLFRLSRKTRSQEFSGLSRRKHVSSCPREHCLTVITRTGSVKMQAHVWVERQMPLNLLRDTRAFHSKEIHLHSKPLQVWEALLQIAPRELQMNQGKMHGFERLREKKPCCLSALSLVDVDRLVTICKAAMLPCPASVVFF